jgi:pimeloyl-ACP methyl ester carboxylesterase
MRPNLMVGEILQQPPSADELPTFLASTMGRMLAAEAVDNLASLTGFFAREPRAVTAALLTRISRDGPGVSEAQLASIKVPTLVIGHGEDVVHPMSNARNLASLIPRARFLEIPPKARGKAQYEAAFRSGLAHFLQEMTS